MDLTVRIEGLDRLASKSKIVSRIAQQEVKKALFVAGSYVEQDAKVSIAQGEKTGRVYKRGNVTHRASAPGEAPASDTGRLVNSINVRPAEGELAVDVVAGGGIVKYARMLEFGTSKMAARPFLFPALEKNKQKIRKRIEAALDKTIDRATKQGLESLKK